MSKKAVFSPVGFILLKPPENNLGAREQQKGQVKTFVLSRFQTAPNDSMSHSGHVVSNLLPS